MTPDASATPSAPERLSAPELRNGLALSGVIFFRIVGLFMLVPVLALYVDEIDGATPTLIGLAVGIYGLTQATFQIPMGAWSDRLGRKPVIVGGLTVFAIGSIVAAFATHIWVIILGRALQGMGAVSSAVLALAADLTRERQRTKINALIGITFGGAFVVGMIAGPWINAVVALKGVFLTAALCAAAAITILLCLVASPEKRAQTGRTGMRWRQMPALFRHERLLPLNLGVFALHFLITAAFLLIPLKLLKEVGTPAESHVWTYLPAMALSIVVLLPILARSGRAAPGAGPHPGWITLLAVISLSYLWPFVSTTDAVVRIALFFVAFNYLEAALPAMVSAAAPDAEKGAALGVYSSCQFAGAFLGGAVGGIALDLMDRSGVALACTAVTVVWLGIALAARARGRPLPA